MYELHMSITPSERKWAQACNNNQFSPVTSHLWICKFESLNWSMIWLFSHRPCLHSVCTVVCRLTAKKRPLCFHKKTKKNNILMQFFPELSSPSNRACFAYCCSRVKGRLHSITQWFFLTKRRMAHKLSRQAGVELEIAVQHKQTNIMGHR